MTERTTRDNAEWLRTVYLNPYNGDDQSVAALAHDYIALLDENRILARAIQDIAFGNLSPEENERIASDAWYTAKEVTSGTD